MTILSWDEIAAKFRSHVSSKSLKETHQLLKSKLGKRHLSKSASELRHRGDTAKFTNQQASTSNESANVVLQQESPSRHATVIQKTQAFFASLKERWSKSRCRDKQNSKSPSEKDYYYEGGDGICEEFQAISDDSPNKVRKVYGHYEVGYSTDYAADNSSDHSSSATPLSQSPFHRAIQKTTSSLSQKLGIIHSAEMNQSTNDISPRIRFEDCRNGDAHDEEMKEVIEPSCTENYSYQNKVDEFRENNKGESGVSRETALRQYSFFQLRIHLKCGRNLIAKDKSGTSDPYVKFKINGKLVYKSKTIYRDLNPLWDESFTLPIEDPFLPVQIKVFDYDWGLQDDFIGATFLDITQLDFGKPHELTLPLEDNKGSENLGEILLTATLWPRTQQDKEQFYKGNAKSQDNNKRLKSQIWSSVVTIVLIKGTNLVSMDSDGLSDPYVKFRLGNEKYKSKVAYKTLNPKWLEQFDLHLYEDQSQELEITIWDKDWTTDDFMGRCTVILSDLEREKTHKITKELEEGCGTISILLTISGTTASETISDLTTYDTNSKEKDIIENRYTVSRTFHNLRDVGHLTVKVYKAQGLASADICGKSDPFCVIELVNARLQTQTEYKTLTPSWQKIFTFNVKDIHSVLEVTVYDEDKDHKVEFLGKIAIPLLRIRNNEKKWYALKDKKLRGRAKGNAPQILLEMNIVWNTVRACIRTLNPKEEKYMQSEMKFKRQVFVRNVMRLKNIIMYFIEFSKFIQSCFEWESTIQSIIALVIFILLCHYFEPYMAPIALLLVFLACYVVQKLTGGWNPNTAVDDEEDIADDDDDDDDKDKEEKRSLKERLQAVQEVTQTVQNSIGYIASLCESVKNTFNFTVPFLTYLAIGLLLTITIVLYFIPVRYLIMIWGINKFSRKLLRPDTVPNNELLDFLSRVPDDEDLISYRELKSQPTTDTERRSRKKPKTS
ncbi:multiple C2 and transmembrane domain-containing protein isoform X2 [Planococcus citri]|uniref:multiple C2 and transmembrane domain-containing protein isoform X2 n=1 Tax=Planococcus citri TaxID=170843 RepID=UPI0031F897CF